VIRNVPGRRRRGVALGPALGEPLPKLLQHCGRRVGGEHGELVAADPRDHFGGTERGAEECCGVREYLVTGGVPRTSLGPFTGSRGTPPE
jgi:hypothetical protein